jgi:hydroxyethylthiazole kinase-like uncharacterized protein yjeF
LADFVRQNFSGRVTVFAGKGNNGGDALAAARRLESWGFEVEVVLPDENLEGVNQKQLKVLQATDVEILDEPSRKADIAVDGLLGYGISGDPRPPYDTLVEEINSMENVVSIDVPTGLDPDTGEGFDPCVEPDYTVTMAAAFKGMDGENSGEVWIADIGLPEKLYSRHGLEEEYFSESSLNGLYR